MKNNSIDLNGDWKLSFTHPDGDKREINATVPGNIEIELQKAGYIKDYWPADNKDALRAFSYVDDWTYETTFDAPEIPNGHTAELVFDGIDTIAEITLNGELIIETKSMFCEHSIAVNGKLKKSGNTLKVVIRSAELYARGFEYGAFGASRFVSEHKSQTYLRKARHQWGWDNAPRILVGGIWRGVHIDILPPARFTDVYMYTKHIDEQVCELGVNWAFATPDKDISGYRGVLELQFGGKQAYLREFNVDFTAGTVRFALDRSEVKLWWPSGYGDANLYDAVLSIYKDDSEVIRWEEKFGIRTVELLRTEYLTEDGYGEFVFVVNGEKVYINGTNWKPTDAMHSKADAKVEQVLDLVMDLNCNMVRIWGGGVYEDHAFFDYCDKNGLLVWQDFMFGCEYPPRDEWYLKQVEEEAIQIIKKLRNHCSLSLWCGDNENDMSHFIWDHMAPNHSLPSDNLISRKVLKEAVMCYDPCRCYLESTPFYSDEIAKIPRGQEADIHMLDQHLYPDTIHFAELMRATPFKFVGETGPIIINAMTDNPNIVKRERPRAKRLWDVPLEPSKRNLDMHQRDDYFMSWRQQGKEVMEHTFSRDFSYDELSDYTIAVNIVCANVFKEVIEYSRSEKWNKTGVLWWSLMDMWPMMFNYSVVDYELHKKLPYYWIRQSQQHVCLMAVRDKDCKEISLYSANETLKNQRGRYSIRAIDCKGKEVDAVASGKFLALPNVNRMIQRLPESDEAQLWIIEWEHDGKTCYNHFVTGSAPYDFEAWKIWVDILKKLYIVD